MIGVNAVPPMPPRLEIEKVPPCMSPALSLPSRARLEISRQLLREVEHALAVGVAHHRHHQAAGRVDGDADVEVLLDDEVLARLVERGVELRELLAAR